MMPPSQLATSKPPNLGAIKTTNPATISTTPTVYMASCALPGRMSLNSVARYAGQFSFSTSANLSRPMRTGRTKKPIRSTLNAWATGSSRTRVIDGNGMGRSVAAIAFICSSFVGGRCIVSDPPGPVLTRDPPSSDAGCGRGGRVGLDQGPQAAMVLSACWAALEVRAHARNRRIGVRPAQLKLEVAIELLEALLAADLWL